MNNRIYRLCFRAKNCYNIFVFTFAGYHDNSDNRRCQLVFVQNKSEICIQKLDTRMDEISDECAT